MKLFLFLLFPLILSCTTHPHSDGRDEYVRTIEKASAGDKQFAGLYDNFEFKATILKRSIARTIHNRMDTYYEWDDETSAENWKKQEEEMRNQSKIWLSFFTPERKNDNLANKKTIWKIYLHAGGRRYEGHVQKANTNFSEAVALIPYHSRWATAYYVNFPVPTDAIENTPLKLVITGPLGRREVNFTSL